MYVISKLPPVPIPPCSSPATFVNVPLPSKAEPSSSNVCNSPPVSTPVTINLRSLVVSAPPNCCPLITTLSPSL